MARLDLSRPFRTHSPAPPPFTCRGYCKTTGGRSDPARGGELCHPPCKPLLGVKPGTKSSPRPLEARHGPPPPLCGDGRAGRDRCGRALPAGTRPPLRGHPEPPRRGSPHPPRSGGASWREDVYPELENGLLKNKPCANSLIFRFDAYLCLPNFIGEALIGVWVIVPK